jgi:hypothetical protein
MSNPMSDNRDSFGDIIPSYQELYIEKCIELIKLRVELSKLRSDSEKVIKDMVEVLKKHNIEILRN